MQNDKLSGFNIFSLREMVEQLGEVQIKNMLSDFSCPLNGDVEYFLKNKAIEFDKQAISKTHLIYTSYQKEVVLIAYFTLAQKVFDIPIKNISKRLRQRIRKFGNYDVSCRSYRITAPLIAQLGKNFNNGYNGLITGDELLAIACKKVSDVQFAIGGKITYIECEDKPQLVDFYKRNGFFVFNQRELDKESKKCGLEGDYLLQLLRYMN